MSTNESTSETTLESTPETRSGTTPEITPESVTEIKSDTLESSNEIKSEEAVLPSTKATCSRLILLLDSSGSMSSQRSDVIGGINETIKHQRASFPDNDDIMFTVITFSNYVNKPINHKLSSVPLFTDRDYAPGGSTALFDAIGSTIDLFSNEENVIFLITTDGAENASKKYNYKQISSAIETIKDTKNWNIIYLSEGIETFEQGNNIGITRGARNCNNVTSGTGKIGSYLSKGACQSAISNMIRGKEGVQMPSSDSEANSNANQDEVIDTTTDTTKETKSFLSSLSSLNPMNFFKK